MNNITIQNIVVVIKAKNQTAQKKTSKLFNYLKSLSGFAMLNELIP